MRRLVFAECAGRLFIENAIDAPRVISRHFQVRLCLLDHILGKHLIDSRRKAPTRATCPSRCRYYGHGHHYSESQCGEKFFHGCHLFSIDRRYPGLTSIYSDELSHHRSRRRQNVHRLRRHPVQSKIPDISTPICCIGLLSRPFGRNIAPIVHKRK
jgi:hypothetical protein